MYTFRLEALQPSLSHTGASDFCQIYPGQVLCIGCSQPKSLRGAAVLEEHSCGSRDDRGLWLPGQWVRLMGRDGQ